MTVHEIYMRTDANIVDLFYLGLKNVTVLRNDGYGHYLLAYGRRRVGVIFGIRGHTFKFKICVGVVTYFILNVPVQVPSGVRRLKMYIFKMYRQ